MLELPRLLNEKYAPLGSILSGITCAGAFAAFMSTFSGLLVSMTGALAHDVYGRMLRPKSTPEQRMRMFKFAAVLIGFISILLGSLVEPLEINFMVGQAFAIAAASLFRSCSSVWWRGMTMRRRGGRHVDRRFSARSSRDVDQREQPRASTKRPMGKIFAGSNPMNDFWRTIRCCASSASNPPSGPCAGDHLDDRGEQRRRKDVPSDADEDAGASCPGKARLKTGIHPGTSGGTLNSRAVV